VTFAVIAFSSGIVRPPHKICDEKACLCILEKIPGVSPGIQGIAYENDKIKMLLAGQSRVKCL
jgi:hypothetical protein